MKPTNSARFYSEMAHGLQSTIDQQGLGERRDGGLGWKGASETQEERRATSRPRESATHRDRRSEGLLDRYFDPRVLTAMQSNPEALSIHSQTVTVCFWDIRDFSMLCEVLKAHPNLIAGFLRDYFQTASEIISEGNGVLDKFIGDGVMALFGSIDGSNDEGRQDALDAVKVALALRARFESVYAEWREKWSLYTPQLFEIGIGCGIHTGEALVGVIGGGCRDQFTALGPHVNFAARLGSRAEKGQVLLSSSTEARVHSYFVLEEAGVLKDVKNIPGLFKVYAVVPPGRRSAR